MNRVLKGFIKKEIIQTLRDPRMRLVLFGMPLLQTILFGFALSMEVKNVRLHAVVAPGDTMMQRVVERSLASGWFVAASAERAEVTLYAPPGGLTQTFGRGEGRLQAMIDATNMLRAQSIERYLSAILNEVARDMGVRPEAPPAVSFSVRMLYNPSQESTIFLIPGLVCMILCIVTILLTAMALAREKELGTFEMLISAPVRRRDIVFGKTLPYVLLALIDVPIILTAGVFVFGVPVRGPLWQLGLGSLFFIFTAVSLGMLISTFARNQQQALMGAFSVTMPAVLLSGMFFPLDNMPEVMQWVTQLNPLRYFVVLLRGVMLKGGDPGIFWPNLAALAALGAAIAWLSIKRFRQTLN